jgi:hypothetical protein
MRTRIMERIDDDLLDRWLRAEDGDDEEAAEAALTALFAALPLAAPAPGFADRFADRMLAGTAPAAGWRWARALAGVLASLLGSAWGRAGVALGLAATALGVPVLRGALPPLLGLFRPALVLPAAARALVEASGWLAAGLRAERWVAGFLRTLLLPFASPAVAAALGACLLVSGLALALLHEIIQRERKWTYVDPIR